MTYPGISTRQLTLAIHNGKEVKVEVHLSLPVIGTVIYVPQKPRKRHGWLMY